MHRPLVSFLLLPALMGVVPAACADQDEVQGRHYKKGAYKEEYWDGHCRIQRSWKANGEYKEKRRCSDRAIVYQEPPGAYNPVAPVGLVINSRMVLRP
jgi:ABC-type glutathione transport system ATPase component